METHPALAHFENGTLTVWASTQKTPFGVRDQVAGVVGLSTEKVRVITPFVGGGFERRVRFGTGRRSRAYRRRSPEPG